MLDARSKLPIVNIPVRNSINVAITRFAIGPAIEMYAFSFCVMVECVCPNISFRMLYIMTAPGAAITKFPSVIIASRSANLRPFHQIWYRAWHPYLIAVNLWASSWGMNAKNIIAR